MYKNSYKKILFLDNFRLSPLVTVAAVSRLRRATPLMDVAAAHIGCYRYALSNDYTYMRPEGSGATMQDSSLHSFSPD